MKQAQPPQLTILTVALDYHYGYVRQQIPLIETLNPGVAFKLIVVDNTGYDAPQLKIKDPRVEVIPGVEPDLSLPDHGRGSYHHAAALAKGLALVDTRYLLILDPDFFVIYRHWISECIEHVERKALSLFGAPWHYSWNRKWRYFPCVHFLLIDLEKVSREDLDFTPALLADAENANSPLHAWMKQHAPVMRGRLLLESRRDTGWRLHRRFSRSLPKAADLALPVIDLKTELRNPRHLTTQWGRWFEQKLPRRWSFLPVEGSYVEADQASGFRFAAIRSLAPEKFMWRGAPFAVHLRGNMREDRRTTANPPYKERAATKTLLEAVTASRSWVEWAFAAPGD